MATASPHAAPKFVRGGLLHMRHGARLEFYDEVTRPQV